MTSRMHLRFPDAILSEGTRVRIAQYEKRPEFVGQDGELGTYSANDKTYEVWLTADEFEGALAFCKPEDFEIVMAPPPDADAKTEEEKEKEDTFDGPFEVGDRVRGKESGSAGTVTAVDEDGDPKVRIDGETEDKQRFGKEFVIIKKVAPNFSVGDKVRGKESGKLGTVIELDEDGDPSVRMDGEKDGQQRYGHEFVLVTKAAFEVGDRVKGIDSKKLGTVTEVDEDGDPKVKIDGEEETVQRFGKEYVIIEKTNVPGQENIKPESSTGKDKEKDKKKKKKKKKKSTSSSSSSPSEIDSKDSWAQRRKDRRKKRAATVWGHNACDRMEEDKRRAAKFQKKYGYSCDQVEKKTESFASFDML